MKKEDSAGGLNKTDPKCPGGWGEGGSEANAKSHLLNGMGTKRGRTISNHTTQNNYMEGRIGTRRGQTKGPMSASLEP